MNQWLDDLSEDWPSQPPTLSSASSLAPSNKLRDSSSHSLDGSSRRRTILTDRSLSEDNIQSQSVRRTEVGRQSRLGLSRRSLSAQSTQPSVQCGTTARKSVSASPPKARLDTNTPEWKRRLLKGEMGYGEQKDLFSPMGIENIFQRPQPPAKQTPQERARGLSFLKSLETVPSSPPPWPLQGQSSQRSPARFGTSSSRNLEVLDEAEENSVQESRIEDEILDEGRQQDDTQSRSQLQSYAQPPLDQSNQSRDMTSRNPSNSSVRFAPMPRQASHANSALSNGGSDDFSPVYISKHNTADGRVDYAAIDLSKSQLAERLRQLAESRASQQSTDTVINGQAPQSDDSSLAGMESALPEDLPVGTPDVASIGEFVSVKRGGYSDMGSFRRRPLSPSPLARPVSTSLDERSEVHHVAGEPLSLEDSVCVHPMVPTPSRFPETPRRMNDSEFLSPHRVKSSNSPLKLFGNHDTFTSNKLQRRISQLEDSIHHTLSQVGSKNSSASPSRRTTGSRLPSVEEASIVKEQANPIGEPSESSILRHSSIASHFGEGQLNEYSFSEDQFSSASLEQSDAGQSIPSRSPSPDVFPPGSQQPFRFFVDSPEPEAGDTFGGKRKLSKTSAKSTISITKRSVRSNRPTVEPAYDETGLTTVASVSYCSEGKRPPASPVKNPTPKRRRTLVQEDTQDQKEVSTVSIHNSHNRFQRAIGKRKDARYDSQSNAAEPDVLALRHILRPRNPTPGGRRRQEIEAELMEAAAEYLSSSPRLEAIQEHLNVPAPPDASFDLLQARAVASEVAAFSERVAHGMKDEGRKRSVTTQDFLDEAMKIMSFIRSKGRPTSGLGSLMEYDSEQLQEDGDELEAPPNPLSLERPPTREGKRSGWRSREQEVDPQVLSHLRRFQEKEDDDFMAASLRSSRFDREVERVASRIDTVESQPPGLHIIDRSPHLHSPKRSRSNSNRSHDGPDSVGTNGTRAPTHSSRTSVDSSLGRTTASRKSDNVATLAPDAVAHLIPEHIAGMTFDKEKGIWVKMKSPKKERRSNEEPSCITQSENDPFDDIPDLTVDEAEETKHLVLNKSASRQDSGKFDVEPTQLSDGDVPNMTSQKQQLDSGGNRNSVVSTTIPPKVPDASSTIWTSSQNLSSLNKVDSSTRATSWEDKKDSFQRDAQNSPITIPASPHPAEGAEVEHEIKIDEGRSNETKHPSSHGFTLSISSPLVPRQYNGLSPVPESPGVSTKDFATKTPRPTPAAEKTKEHRQLSLSVRLSGAVATNNDTSALEKVSSSPCKADVTFYLSELPEFTLTQVDERELPDRVLTKRNTISRARGLEDRFASGNHLLVKALQDVEPEEPFWEDLRQVDLLGKGLTSLHLFDLFCERVEKVDVSSNKICVLNGAPSTIRCLNIHNNLLTSLTSWGHLMNLQYLDVSNNKIDSLEGFACLIHLRELRVDGNRVQTLDGIEGLDGLLTLSLRNNKIKEVNFEGSALQRLSSLDLKGNDLAFVRGLHCLPALTDLNLDDNELKQFPQENASCPRMKSLSLRNNRLEELDVTKFAPKLRRLHVDANSLVSTSGVSQLKHLQILSMRSQTPSDGTCDLQPLLESRMAQLESLSLSENHVPSLQLPTDWFSLRHLELASCGLNSLPDSFGLSVPNLRSLNLNFNAIKDIRPVLNIKGLTSILLCGNRLSRLRKTAAVLSKLASLESLDLRDNPFSIGFYPKPVEQRLVTTNHSLPEDDEATSKANDLDEEPLQFTLPPCTRDTDRQYFSRLDEGTKLRRRVYEMLLAGGCGALSSLDGMDFVKKDILVKDKTWDRLVLLGVIKKSGRVVETPEREL